MITVVEATVGIEGVLYQTAVSDDGDYLYEPRFISLRCWEELEEELREQVEDVPPIDDSRSILECSTCNSGIRMGELLCLATFGEVHLSHRYPNGEDVRTFIIYTNEPTVLCIACLRTLNDNLCELWSDGVQYESECSAGTQARCWRYGCPGSHNCMNEE